MHSGTVRRNSGRILGCKFGEFWHSRAKFSGGVCGRNLTKICHLRGPVPLMEEVLVHHDSRTAPRQPAAAVRRKSEVQK